MAHLLFGILNKLTGKPWGDQQFFIKLRCRAKPTELEAIASKKKDPSQPRTTKLLSGGKKKAFLP
jgi:hypothetical protein